jgi:protein-disulfide isomerase
MIKLQHIWWCFALLLAAAGASRAAEPSLAPTDMILGKADAPITIIEYASLTCPHCAEFDVETFPKVKSDWIDTGKAKYAFRDFPLNDGAVTAAEVAHCAAPAQFFAFIDVLFRNQEHWIAADGIHADPEALGRIARLGGVSPDKLKSCTSDQALNARILGDRLTAQNEYGVDSTPTFFINGKKVEPAGFMPYDQFEKHLTAAAADNGTLRFGAK